MVKMIVDAIGDHCPIPVVKTKKALGELNGAGQIEVLVDNETAMKNVMKMAKSSGASAKAEQISEREYKVIITVEEKNAAASGNDQKGQTAGKESRAQAEGWMKETGESDHNPADDEGGTEAENGNGSRIRGISEAQSVSASSAGCADCIGTVVAVSSDKMGSGNDELGAVLMKSFFFAETQLDALPDKILFYNGGAKLTAEDSDCLEDIRLLEKEGVEILTCGTCLDFYGLKEKLAVGAVTNMYTIAEILQNAVSVVSP